jgi:hypothetical protein
MTGARKKLPTSYQASWLRRMAVSPMMVTYVDGENERYGLFDGSTVPASTARILIRNGWVRPDRESGLFDRPQVYRVLTPTS